MQDSLSKDHRLWVGVDPLATGIEAIEERVHGGGVDIAEHFKLDGIHIVGGRQGWTVFGHSNSMVKQCLAETARQ